MIERFVVRLGGVVVAAAVFVSSVGAAEPMVLTGHTGAVPAVALSPDGKLLATGGADKLVKLWDLATGKELRSLVAHNDAVTAVRHFMAGFFLVFSFFKLLDITAFADAYRTYDVVAARTCPGVISANTDTAVINAVARKALAIDSILLSRRRRPRGPSVGSGRAES